MGLGSVAGNLPQDEPVLLVHSIPPEVARGDSRSLVIEWPELYNVVVVLSRDVIVLSHDPARSWVRRALRGWI